MKKYLTLSLSIFFANINFAIANDDEMVNKCEKSGVKVVKITAGAQRIKNIEPLATWRASCAERPPVGIYGELVALCDGDLVSKNGASRRIFYWEGTGKKGEEIIGYHLCARN